MPFNFQHYVFDLDNTLYPASCSFFDLQLENMSDFIQKELNVPRHEADFLREDYYHTFGTTMHGMIENHNTKADAFLAAIDDLPLDRLQPNQQLLTLFSQLQDQGKHLSVFTNGSRYHAERVMKKLNLDTIFQDVVTLECTGLIPKPKEEAFLYCFKHLNIDPSKAVFFEDSSHNLVTAKEFGMKTVLINADDTAHARFVAHQEIDYFVEDVESFFQQNFLDAR